MSVFEEARCDPENGILELPIGPGLDIYFIMRVPDDGQANLLRRTLCAGLEAVLRHIEEFGRACAAEAVHMILSVFG